MNLEEIKEKLEDDDKFQYYKDEIGISWDDFKIIDLLTDTVLKQGSTKIGDYCILVDSDEIKIKYDLTADGLADKRLAKVQKPNMIKQV